MMSKGTIKYLNHSPEQASQDLAPLVSKLEEIKQIILESPDAKPIIHVATKEPQVDIHVPVPKVDVHVQPSMPHLEVNPTVEIVDNINYGKLFLITLLPSSVMICDIILRIILK